MTKTDPLDPNVPAGSESPKFGDDKIRALARAVAELLNVDHYIGTDGGAGTGYNEDAAGEHKKVKFNAPISTPTNEADKMFIYGKDVGGKIELHCLDEDGNEIQLTSGGNLHSNQDFTMLSGKTATIETIKAVDSTGLLLKNDGDDTIITVGDDGTATLADGSQLATNADPTTEADIANKKYVDDQIDTKNFGTFTTEDDENNTMLASHAYLANQDGFVVVLFTQTNQTCQCDCYVSNTSNPVSTGYIMAQFLNQTYSQTNDRGSLTFPVASGKYFELYTYNMSVTIYWNPIGTLVKPTDYN